jgi:hypothetical protein
MGANGKAIGGKDGRCCAAAETGNASSTITEAK